MSVVRLATAADNAALMNIAALSPMEGRVGLCINRSPDFFALNRLEGEDVRVGVVPDADDVAIGCIAVARRELFLNGEPTTAAYVSDLKVHPASRGRRVAESLADWAREQAHEMCPDGAPALATVLAGNRPMEVRMKGPESFAMLRPFATLRSYSIPLLRRRYRPSASMHVRVASNDDVESMVELWNRVAPGRQFAPVLTAESFRAWVETAPGLSISDYSLVFDKAGTLLGLAGIWDQRSFKQTRVTSYSSSLNVFRAAFNALAPLTGATRLPPVDEELHNLSAVNVCVEQSRPDVLAELLRHAVAAWTGRGYSFLSVGLDHTDPLTAGVKGLLAQGTDVWGCVIPWSKQPLPVDSLKSLPFHHEIALV